MNENQTTCDDAALEAILRSDALLEPSLELLAHIEFCTRCQERICELAGPLTMWQSVKTACSNPAASSQQHHFPLLSIEQPHLHWTESMAKQLLAPPSHPEMLGRLGRYEVERLIGSGGMGVVFKAFDSELNRPVAIKLLAPYLASSGPARKRFAREARAAAAVVHQHVVPIHNVETERESPFIVMQFVSGESLQARIDREGALELCEILRIGMQVADGLSAAHQQGLVHRDIKPSNILLEEDVDRALISDFGLARAADDASLTRTGFHPGTPQYMSPEQAAGQSVDARSDLFSLGSVLYTMCTGRPPFQAENSLIVMRRIADSEATPIREINPNIPDWLAGTVMKLMSKEKGDRLQSAKQVHCLLEAFLRHVQDPQTNRIPIVLSSGKSGLKKAFQFFLRRRVVMKLTFAGICLWVGSMLPGVSQMLTIQTLTLPQTSGENPANKTELQGAIPQAGEIAKVQTAAESEIVLFEVTVNGKQGFIDKNGKIVIEPKYDKVFRFSDGLAAIQVGEVWGFIDYQDNVIVEPQFIQVAPFSDGYAAVKLRKFTDRWGFIDTEGKMVIEPQFDHVEGFRNGIAKVGMVALRGAFLSIIADVGPELDYHYIGIHGNKVPEPAPEHYATGKPGELISFHKERLVGFVNARGEVIIEPQFLAAGEFSDGLARACKEKLFGYIDESGEFVIPPTFQYANEFSDGLAGVQIEEGKWGFINKSGKIVIPASYNWVYGGFREGLAQVTVAGRVGYINQKGEWVW
jgi:serine/threonine protein kinase